MFLTLFLFRVRLDFFTCEPWIVGSDFFIKSFPLGEDLDEKDSENIKWPSNFIGLNINFKNLIFLKNTDKTLVVLRCIEKNINKIEVTKRKVVNIEKNKNFLICSPKDWFIISSKKLPRRLFDISV